MAQATALAHRVQHNLEAQVPMKIQTRQIPIHNEAEYFQVARPMRIATLVVGYLIVKRTTKCAKKNWSMRLELEYGRW